MARRSLLRHPQAQSGFKLCFKHGGGKRCANINCNKAVTAASIFCKEHTDPAALVQAHHQPPPQPHPLMVPPPPVAHHSAMMAAPLATPAMMGGGAMMAAPTMMPPAMMMAAAALPTMGDSVDVPKRKALVPPDVAEAEAKKHKPETMPTAV